MDYGHLLGMKFSIIYFILGLEDCFDSRTTDKGEKGRKGKTNHWIKIQKQKE